MLLFTGLEQGAALFAEWRGNTLAAAALLLINLGARSLQMRFPAVTNTFETLVLLSALRQRGTDARRRKVRETQSPCSPKSRRMPSSVAGHIPRSVIRPVTSRAGVTSKP